MSCTVAVHQPNFFPWLGYFDKIARCDVFVLLDNVQYPKTGGAWCNRVKFLVADEPRWVTATVDRNYHGTRTIREMRFAAGGSWRSKSLKTIEANYRRHPFYAECMAVVEPLLTLQENNIAAFNFNAIKAICYALSLDTSKLRMSSELEVSGSSNELLCGITRAVGGHVYMYGGGAEGYQNDAVFAESGVELRPQAFKHPVYEQYHTPQFVSGLSVIDAVMNLGWHGSAAMLSQTC